MQKIFALTVVGVTIAGLGFGQIKKQFSVEDNASCDKIKLTVRSNSGTCFLKPSHNPEILSVFSNQSTDDFSHQFKKTVNGKTCEVMLALEEEQSEGLSYTISTKVFGPEKPVKRNSGKCI
jgi:molybdenum cofactor biosynthesis enzyme MoaA